jgi:uncharacterized protein YciI
VASLFVLDLTYVVDLPEVERHMDGHREFLQRNYDAGLFLASGRKQPRTGGVILATGDRATIEAAIEADPFKRHGIATYTVTEFLPTMTASPLGGFHP